MNQKKKTIAIAAAIIAVFLAAACAATFIEFPWRVLRVQSADAPVTVSFYLKQSVIGSLFAPAFMGQSYDYDIVIKGNGPLGKEYLRDSFTFAGDGSQIDESCVSVFFENGTATITISGEEMNTRKFEVIVG